MKVLRGIVAILLATLLFVAMVGCAENQPAQDETPDPELANPEIEPGDDQKVTFPLPEKGFGGDEFIIICREDKFYEFDPELTGSNVSDAIYYRNLDLEERYDVEIASYQVAGNWGSRQTFIDAIRNDAASGDQYIDLIAGYCAYMPTLVLDGYCKNLHELPLVNFDHDWWYDGFNKNMSINDKLYMAVGDATLTMWENLQVVFFDKKMLTDYQLAYPYEMVTEGTWDFATLREYCAYHARDIDDNGAMDISDHWGMLFYNKRDLMVYFENPYTAIDEEGKPYLDVYGDHFVEIYGEIYKFMFEDEMGQQFKPDELTPMFRNGQTMFVQAPLRYTEIFRANDNDFGIVPFPKYDESQERYYTPVVDDLSVLCVPLTVTNEELTAYMMEAIGYENNREIVPLYIDEAITNRGFRDSESGEMLNVVRDSVWFEFGFVYSQNCGLLGQILDCLSKGQTDITAYYKRYESAYQTGLEELIKFYFEE